MAAPAGSDHLSLTITETGLPMATLVRNLQAAGARGGLKREINAALVAAGVPLAQFARRGARETLPKRGGLAAFVAGSRFDTGVRVVGQDVVLRLTATNGRHDLQAMNRGRLRHPVYGNRKVWVNQRCAPHWFDRYEPLGEAAARALLVRAADKIANQITRK